MHYKIFKTPGTDYILAMYIDDIIIVGYDFSDCLKHVCERAILLNKHFIRALTLC